MRQRFDIRGGAWVYLDLAGLYAGQPVTVAEVQAAFDDFEGSP